MKAGSRIKKQPALKFMAAAGPKGDHNFMPAGVPDGQLREK
ncbi:hypothetical protein N288_25330 [Bacillus infantis NRRL B-14911]|uniref:Uncharacterized protein n=1 Tax=Bacillus infantis NRRL B-14911 TaxID=1367477 RepID=U5LHH8_9BACI|nr:hypothetical protein N288_25330 [Bacillus infantis NRRL B-14911]